MSFDLVPGNALGCRTNAHRHGWNGKICENASAWSCGIDQDFREKYCESGIPRCFHLHIFDETDPCLVIPDSGVGWILERDPHAFDDQLLLVWAPASEEPHGAVGGRPSPSLMAGAYRIRSAERLDHRNHVEWQIRPHEDGWAYLGSLEIPAPRFIHLDGPYIKQVERTHVERMFQNAVELSGELDEDWTELDRTRLQRFAAQLEGWLEVARERAPVPREGRSRAVLTPARRGQPPQAAGAPRSGNGHPEPAAEPPAPMEEPPARVPLIEEPKRDAIAELYGESTLKALLVGSMTKPIVILSGEPGVGKSRLAVELIDDVARERTLVVPVAANWRGPEDLMGQVNQVKNLFEPTRFTNFLRRAQLAWESGDRRAHVVVFDDFDLSPPDLWLSEVLARAQYPAECRRDRTIELGGHAVRGWERGSENRIYLSPAVRFVATVDLDRATRPLSLRVLDRSAVVPLALAPEAALQRTGVKVTPKQLEAIEGLSELTGPRRASFSLHAALALKACLAELEPLGLDAWSALDLVLRQELLAKLERDTGSPRDAQLLGALADWRASFGGKLRECAAALDALGAAAAPANAPA